LTLGVDGVWMGSRFIVTPEANAPPELKEHLVKATSDDTVHTRLYTGRTLRALASPYHSEWEGPRVVEMREMLEQGKVPFDKDARKGRFGKDQYAVGWWIGGYTPDTWLDRRKPIPDGVDLLSMGITVGQSVGALKSIEPAEEVLRSLTAQLQEALKAMPSSRL